MKAFDWLSSGARLMSWFHQLSAGNSVRPLKSSFSATPVDGVDGVLGVLGPVGVEGSDGESFTPPHAAIPTLQSASAVMSSGRGREVTANPKPRRGIGSGSRRDYEFRPAIPPIGTRRRNLSQSGVSF